MSAPKDESFGKARRLRKGREFDRVKRLGKRFRYSKLHFMVALREDGLVPARLGLVVSKRIGNAAARNRVKRRCREAFRRAPWAKNAPYDVVAIAQPGAAELSFEAAEEALARLGDDVRKVAPALAQRAAIRQGAGAPEADASNRRPTNSP